MILWGDMGGYKKELYPPLRIHQLYIFLAVQGAVCYKFSVPHNNLNKTKRYIFQIASFAK